MPSLGGPTTAFTAACLGLLSTWGVYDWRGRQPIMEPAAHVDLHETLQDLQEAIDSVMEERSPSKISMAERELMTVAKHRRVTATCPAQRLDLAISKRRRHGTQAAPQATGAKNLTPNAASADLIKASLPELVEEPPHPSGPQGIPSAAEASDSDGENVSHTFASLRWTWILFAFTVPFDMLLMWLGAAACMARRRKAQQANSSPSAPEVSSSAPRSFEFLHANSPSAPAISSSSMPALALPAQSCVLESSNKAAALEPEKAPTGTIGTQERTLAGTLEPASDVPLRERLQQRKKASGASSGSATLPRSLAKDAEVVPASASGNESAKTKATSRLLAAGFALSDQADIKVPKQAPEEQPTGPLLHALPTPTRNANGGKAWARSPGRSRRAEA